ncbi:MAG: PIN domain-containing protein [Hydrogenophaga sp.]|uniref:type II toxin-antitoxin system VapC family toxin n=1 Tax=Hydrogenophaga sp. TaxID=1904254 RepID=UPI001690DCFC|nr:type II toxin-antitoxin system VapC family toxin [Hydrogenophaga sp.]NIM43042.1 PIN domain-containing protein [Hydrogenophaga sp.]NIN28110.1 PIN domain-containing protein [Hydrogenophaga sp.]NIN30548.1 PIN domain-containing protein [Hydrogenophaga sp.]NIN57245.1 PIN domain-containing protein [Hydrogenophaga sp.]NIO51464.1 PIN domain-containing protein [Hydrogenophaga sp.]
MSGAGPFASGHVAEPDPRYLREGGVSGTLVDTCVLIDVFADDPNWADWSIDQLERCADTGPLLINPIILAELSPRFETAADLEATLAGLPLQRAQLPWDAAFLAGQAFKLYRREQGQRSAPLPDFYIGAHAWLQGLQLLTRDPNRFRRHFPRLPLVTPS